MYKIKNMNSPLFSPDTVFTVTQITTLLKDMIEGTFPSIVLEGEISNFKPSSSGHVYFVIKDSTAQISAVMFRMNVMHLSFVPKDGMLVRCTGKLSVYAARGNYQIIVSTMQMAGAGNILQMLEERKQKLAAEGLFDESRKRPLPPFPKTIGVITSPTGAALRDILQITKRRNPSVSVVILPSQVQGDGAAETIVRQIQTANAFNMCDILIVGRGGGSLEDLLPFSEESVVRAIAASRIPVVSAVGHEIDWALSDYAADRRAPIPSAAAELVVPQKADILNDLQGYSEELYDTIQAKIDKVRLMIKAYNVENMEMQFRTIEQPLLSRFDNAKTALLENMDRRLADTKQHIENCVQLLESASPQTILARGYSMVRDVHTRRIIRSGTDTAVNSEIEIIPAHGRITASVTAVSSADTENATQGGPQ